MRMHPAGAAVTTLSLMACSNISTIDLPLPVHSRSHLERSESRAMILFNGNTIDSRWPEVQTAIADVYGNTEQAQASAAAATATVARACQPAPQPQPDAEASRRAPAPRAAFVPAFAVPLVTALIDAGAAAAKRQIDRFASTYEASWSARYVGEFYDNAPTAGVETAALKHTCFAVIRRVEQRGAPSTVFLHIGRLHRSTDGTAVRLDPLLHAHSGTKARVGSGGSFTSAMTVTVQGVWIDQRQSVVATRDVVFSTVLDFGAGNLNATAPRLYETEAKQLAASSGWFPFVPISLRNGQVIGTGPVNITATVAETAAARDLASAAASGADTLVDKIAERVRDELAASH